MNEYIDKWSKLISESCEEEDIEIQNETEEEGDKELEKLVDRYVEAKIERESASKNLSYWSNRAESFIDNPKYRSYDTGTGRTYRDIAKQQAGGSDYVDRRCDQAQERYNDAEHKRGVLFGELNPKLKEVADKHPLVQGQNCEYKGFGIETEKINGKTYIRLHYIQNGKDVYVVIKGNGLTSSFFKKLLSKNEIDEQMRLYKRVSAKRGRRF